jgi:hypothetical protein
MKISRKLLALLLSFTLIVTMALPSAYAVTDDTNSVMYTVLVLDTSAAQRFYYSNQLIYTSDPALEYVKPAAKSFVEGIMSTNETNYVAIIAYNETARVISDFTTDISGLSEVIDSLSSSGDPNIGNGLNMANALLNKVSDNNAVKNVVLFSTGMTTGGTYNYSGHYSSKTVGSDWENISTNIKLYAYANVAYASAENVKSAATLYSIGLFQAMEGIPSNGVPVAQFFRLSAKDFATSDNYFYDTEDPNDLRLIFGEVLHDILYPVEITLSHLLTDSQEGIRDINLSTTLKYRRDTYRITANIINTNQTGELTNLKLTLALPDNLVSLTNVELASGVNSEVHMFSLAPEGTASASWDIEYTCYNQSSDQNFEYSVTVTSDNAVTVSNYGSIFVHGYNETNNILDFNKDTWNFKNYDTGVKERNDDGTVKSYYPIPISTDDANALKYGMSNTEKSDIDDKIAGGAGGQCYGMAITAALAKVDRFDLNYIQPGAANLHAISKNSKAQSAIGYYYMAQYLDEHKTHFTEFESYSVSEQLKIIEQLADAVDSGGNPFVLSFWFDKDYDGIKDDTGHAVTAYSSERGSWKFDANWLGQGGVAYNSRILIYDNNSPNWDEEFCLYYNNNTDEWTIPAYFGSSASDGKDRDALLAGAMADVNLMDIRSLAANLKNVKSSLRAKNNTDLLIKLHDKTITINGADTHGATDVTVFPDLAGSSNAVNIYMDDMEQPFEIEPQTAGAALDVSVKYAETYAAIEADTVNSTSFTPDGKVGIEGNGGAYSMTLSADDSPLKWYEINTAGTYKSTVSLELVDDGYLLCGDSLSNIKVTGKNDDEIEDLSFSTNKENVLIAQQSGELVALVDNDGNGTYETKLITTAAMPGAQSSSPSNVSTNADEPDPAVLPDDVPAIEESAQMPFTDISESDWFYSDVEYVYANALMNGMTATTFSPNTTMTRAMLVTVLYRLASPARGANTTQFTDVPLGEWYSDAVAWASGTGIVSGIGDNRFAPDAEITRQDMAVLLARYADTMGIALTASRGPSAFSDDSDVAEYAKDAAALLYSAGVVNGKPGGLFDPHGSATRAEVAAMLHRFILAIE